MSPERWERAKEIFDEASEKTPAERSEFLDRACGGDRVLHKEVESLLAQEAQAGSFLLAPLMQFQDSYIGTKLLHYEILEKLGEGGMGVVYKVRDCRLDRVVAMKMMSRSRTVGSEYADVARRQLTDEARMAGRLSHPNIAQLFDVGECDGTAYITLELAPGRDLKKLIADSGAFSLHRAIKIVRQVCDGLAHAHARGVVHRDIKPGNILVDENSNVKITDFGVAQLFASGENSITHSASAGTPGYMAPEQLSGDLVDARADQFSVACLTYELLTGQAPFLAIHQRPYVRGISPPVLHYPVE